MAVHQQTRYEEMFMGLYIPMKSEAERQSDYDAAKARIVAINPDFVFLLQRGSPLPDPHDNSEAARQFRTAYQAVRKTQMHF